MKKSAIVAIVLAVFALAPAAHARALVTAGSHELGLSGMLDFNSEVGTASALDARFDWFFVDQFSFGLVGGFSDNDYYTHIRLGLSSEYNFLISDDYRPLVGTDFVPFLGLGVSCAYADSDEDDHFAGVFSGEGGLKFFLSDDFAIVASVLGELATDDIFMNDDKSSSADVSLRLGMRFFF